MGIFGKLLGRSGRDGQPSQERNFDVSDLNVPPLADAVDALRTKTVPLSETNDTAESVKGPALGNDAAKGKESISRTRQRDWLPLSADLIYVNRTGCSCHYDSCGHFLSESVDLSATSSIC